MQCERNWRAALTPPNELAVADDGGMSETEPTVTRDDRRHRFEITYDGEVVGFTTFREAGNTRVFLHTEIDPKVEGKGLGGRLVRESLDQTRADQMLVDPQCPFTRAFIERHPEYADLVAGEPTP